MLCFDKKIKETAMFYHNFKTFNAVVLDGKLTVTFDHPSMNIQDLSMIDDLKPHVKARYMPLLINL